MPTERPVPPRPSGQPADPDPAAHPAGLTAADPNPADASPAYLSPADPNPTERPYRRGDTIPGLFAWCVGRWPDATALVDGATRLTYAELDAWSDADAAALQRLGVGPGDFVAVLLPRTARTVAVLLGILKTGAAYAAIDPAWPRERQEWLLAEVRPRVLVGGDAAATVPTGQPPAPDDPGHTGHPSPVAIAGTDPCAVFFTSGSTGTPKGVVLPHRGAARLYDDDPFAEFGRGMVLPQMFALHWDGPILDLWGPLLCGGTSVIASDVLQPGLLRQLCASEGVNAAVLPTAVFNMIVDEDIEALAPLRWLITGSEKVSPAHLERVLRRFPEVRLSNGYGPVESTALVTIHRIVPADIDDPGGVPIGRVMNNSLVYVLDGDRRCAPGETGEICLGGHGLALHYLNLPELTEQKFVTQVIDGEPVRLYRTGDLGHFSADGVLYFAGRNDRQVKIRGHRIEPGEIERTADSLPGVRRSAVVAVTGTADIGESLALFYVPDEEKPADPTAVRSGLAARLPAYLVPRDIVAVDAIPLTRNGKVDRTALAARVPDRAAEPAGALPEGDAETVLTAAFAQLLPGAEFGPADSFFDLGGSSLDAARLCARVGAAVGRSIPVSQLYRTPSVTGLAGWLGLLSTVDAPRGASVEAGGPVPLTAGQLTYA
ncbi:MAG TPA: non-ribosomal peptide synthetase, partial [Rugosimonospora sp.]|nr:non-ribosomal peptide synthetase [Rugosimonospora sp.]